MCGTEGECEMIYNQENITGFRKPDAVAAPWYENMGDIPKHLEYSNGTMYEKLAEVAKEFPTNIAFDFMGKHTTYKQLLDKISACARSLRTIGVSRDDKITIAMPNCPQAIYMLYAVNRVGAVANMIHQHVEQYDNRYA